jgi:hypothetical protein
VRPSWVLIAALSLAYGALVAFLPETTVSPGDLIEGHREFAADCFACHAPFGGTPAARCVKCHALETIGISTTHGAALARKEGRPRFHQALLEPSCASCHADHRGPDAATALLAFSHELLVPAARSACADCHASRKPADELHRQTALSCGNCHGTQAWKPASFAHDSLAAEQRARCVSCHARVRPTDSLHGAAGDDCASCHGTQAWKPATFEHEKYFRFDRNHPASECRTCHPQQLDRYTCYGCHEHTRTQIAAEHREEGIVDFEDCVRCHRSGSEHEVEGGGHRERREGSSGSEHEAERGGHRERREGRDDDD